jgi:hypothetical protein
LIFSAANSSELYWLKPMRTAVFAAVLTLAVASPARAELRVSMHDGLVTVTASDVTVRQILAEWARVGQTKMVNAEGVTGGPVTLQLSDVPEEEALDILLRSTSGYLAALRVSFVANASQFDRVVIMPTSSPTNSPTRPSTSAPLAAGQTRVQAPVTTEPDDDAPVNRPSPVPPFAQQPPGGPAFNAFPQNGPVTNGPFTAPQLPAATPPPTGLSVPGMIIPAAPAPGQPGQAPGQSGQR